MHIELSYLFWKTTVLDVGDEIQRVTGRKDEYHEVDEFIYCNGCRFDHKDLKDWTIEGPRAFEKTR
jgi:NADH-quinone oxidoreductase subunit G